MKTVKPGSRTLSYGLAWLSGVYLTQKQDGSYVTTPVRPITDAEENELLRLKAKYPSRIVFSVIDKNTGAFMTYAHRNRAGMNRALRAGHYVAHLVLRDMGA